MIQEEKQVWLDWRIDVYSTNTYTLITVGFFPSLFFSTAWGCNSINSSGLGWGVLMSSALLTGLKSHWQLWRRKAWTCRSDNLYPYLREIYWRLQENDKNLNSSWLSLYRRVIQKPIFICKQAFISVSTSPEQKQMKWTRNKPHMVSWMQKLCSLLSVAFQFDRNYCSHVSISLTQTSTKLVSHSWLLLYNFYQIKNASLINTWF